MRLSMRAAAAALALALSACAEALPTAAPLQLLASERPQSEWSLLTVRHSALQISGFSADQRRDIERAVRDAEVLWDVKIDIVAHGKWTHQVVAQLGKRPLNQHALAVTQGRTVTVYLDNDTVRTGLCGIMLHEIGHLLGLAHAEIGVMRPVYSRLTHRCSSDPSP